VPRTTEGWRTACSRALPGAGQAAEPSRADAVACPVAFRYRTDGGLLDRAPRTVAEIVAARGLVVEVHLLPALELGVPASPARLVPAA
jgi:hypothetical protein